MTSETIIDQLVQLMNTLQVREIGANEVTLTPSKAKVFGEFPFDITPDEDLEVLKSDAFTINNLPLVCAITIDEKALTSEELGDTSLELDNVLQSVPYATDQERFTFRIWVWMQFHSDSSRLSKRYRNAIKDLLRQTPKLGFTGDNADSIVKVSRLRTSLVELFYSKSGAVHIIGNDLDVTVIN